MLAVVARVPVAAGSESVFDPRAPVTGANVTDPEVALAKATDPTTDPATPNVGVAVAATLAVDPVALPRTVPPATCARIESGTVFAPATVPPNVGLVRVLFVNVCVAARYANESFAPGSGSVSVRADVATDAGVIVRVFALPEFARAKVPVADDGTPNVGVAVKAGDAPARTCPAAPVIETAPAALTATGAVPVIAPPPDDVTHVAHVRLPVVALRASGDEAPTANVPDVFGHVSATAVPATA